MKLGVLHRSMSFPDSKAWMYLVQVHEKVFWAKDDFYMEYPLDETFGKFHTKKREKIKLNL